MARLVLASRSPQRRSILASVGLEFDVRPVDVEEETEGRPVALARRNALRKALGAHPGPSEMVIGVDTVVALDDQIFGKPRDAPEALATLRALSGRAHRVLTGLALLERGRPARVRVAETLVTFRELDEGMLDWYVETGEWRERAGGYAVQGAGGALVRRLEGDLLNVIGLPLATLLDLEPGLLARAG
jgi:septum formation protein